MAWPGGKMTTFRSMAQWGEAMKIRIKRIEKRAEMNPLQASSYATLQLKRMAPRKSGKLMAGIRKFKKRRGRWVVVSVVPKKGMTHGAYNLWVNGNIPTMRLPITKDFSKGAPRVARTYASTNHTGTPGYFNIAAKMTAKRYHNLNVKLIPKAMGGTT